MQDSVSQVIQASSIPINQQQYHSSIKKCPYDLCPNICSCSPYQENFTPNINTVLHSGLLVNNPNNPGLSLKQGFISYRQIQGIPIKQIVKLKLCQRNDYLLMSTLQIYLQDNEDKPISIGFNKLDGQIWFIAAIQAKLAVQHQYKVNNVQVPQKINGILYKKTTFGKWKMRAGSCSLNPKCFKLEEQYSAINATNQLWTRFDLILQRVPCLVVKLWGSLGKKQLAIPLSQLISWLTAFCSLL